MFINLKELTKYLRQNGSKDLEVTHIHSGDKCFLAYQFYLNANRLNYIAFINKESLEIERFDEDLDNDEFEERLEHWTIRKLFKGDGVNPIEESETDVNCCKSCNVHTVHKCEKCSQFTCDNCLIYFGSTSSTCKAWCVDCYAR